MQDGAEESLNSELRTPATPSIIPQLDALLETRGEEVCDWFAAMRARTQPAFYASVDVRHAGYKIAPVDTNLFPAGFNNLSIPARLRAARKMRDYLARYYPQAKRVLLLPERHTRNLYYLENIAVLSGLLRNAGMEVRLGMMEEGEGETLQLHSISGIPLEVEPITLMGDRVQTQSGFIPDLLVVNNDLTSGVPDWMTRITQPIVPPVEMGWYRRRKWVHFAAYAELAEQFGAAFGIDPWLIQPLTRHCGSVNFKERTGVDQVAAEVDAMVRLIQAKYTQYGIADEPVVFIKASSGTYGMGIMTARSGEEVLAMNKKHRDRMHVIKEGVGNSEVVIQEGVPSVDRVGTYTAEPMLYLIGGCAVGGAWRVHPEKDAFSSLNSPGMQFTPLCDGASVDAPCGEVLKDCPPPVRIASLIAELAALAATREEYDSYQI